MQPVICHNTQSKNTTSNQVHAFYFILIKVVWGPRKLIAKNWFWTPKNCTSACLIEKLVWASCILDPQATMIRPRSHKRCFPEASERHKTSPDSSVRHCFQQFMQWLEWYLGNHLVCQVVGYPGFILMVCFTHVEQLLNSVGTNWKRLQQRSWSLCHVVVNVGIKPLGTWWSEEITESSHVMFSRMAKYSSLTAFYTFSEQQPKAIDDKVCLHQSWSLCTERWKVQKYLLFLEYLKLNVNCSCVRKENTKQKK